MTHWNSLLLTILISTCCSAQSVHIRGGGEAREWDDFPESCEHLGHWEFDRLLHEGPQPREQTLMLVQDNVQWRWKVELNGTYLGRLLEDEQQQGIAFGIPPGTLKEGAGANRLVITHESGQRPDDIRIDAVRILSTTKTETLNLHRLKVEVREDGASGPLPCRITLVDDNGALIPLGNQSNDRIAARCGVVYTLDGRAELRFAPPSGKTVTVFASRGFEYSMDRLTLPLAELPETVSLTLRREVDTSGLASIDPHTHTATHSRHGDCSITERMITIAGEGLDLAVATDHNLNIDYRKEMDRIGCRAFTPVVGNEYTTRTGHFNLFPCDPTTSPPVYIGTSWPGVQAGIQDSDARIAILNHPRDTQTGYRPFDPANHDAFLGQSRDGRDYGFFSAMTVWNSGATQSHPFQLIRDWGALTDRGWTIAPIGCSDSHDVSRYVVGQARTYVAVDDTDSGAIAVGAVCDEILAGRTQVAAGYLVEAVPDADSATIRVQHPSWIPAPRVRLLGSQGAEYPCKKNPDGSWKATLPKSTNDYWIIACADSSSPQPPFWPLARPYKPDTKRFRPSYAGFSRPLFIDANQDGRWTAAAQQTRDLLNLAPEAFLPAITAVSPEIDRFLYLSAKAEAIPQALWDAHPKAQKRRLELKLLQEKAHDEDRLENWGN